MHFLAISKKYKGYVFLDENEDGTQTELKSCNANYLYKEFLLIEEKMRDIEFFKVVDEQALTSEGTDLLDGGSGLSSGSQVSLTDDSQ